MTGPRVDAALAALRAGALVLLLDDDDREAEGDLVVAAEHADPAVVNTMITHGCGLLCVAVDGATTDRLRLQPMVSRNDAPHHTAFTVSVDIDNGGTGISVKDRSATLKAIADPGSRPEDFVRPGHIFPLRADPGGSFARRGHTEASLDLVTLAGLRPAAAICEVLDEAGEPARRPYLTALAQRLGIPILDVADVIAHRAHQGVTRVVETVLPLPEGRFRTLGYRDVLGGEHLALVLGEPAGHDDAPVAVHVECVLGEALGSRLCGCEDQLHTALRRVADAGRGAVLYLRPGAAVGPARRLRGPLATHQALDPHDEWLSAGIARDLGLRLPVPSEAAKGPHAC